MRQQRKPRYAFRMFIWIRAFPSGSVLMEPVSLLGLKPGICYVSNVVNISTDSTAVAVLCIPIILPNEDLVAVVEFYRSWRDACYTAQDLEFVQVPVTSLFTLTRDIYIIDSRLATIY